MSQTQLISRKAAISSQKFALLKVTLMGKQPGTIYKTATLRQNLAVSHSEIGWMINELKHLGIIRHFSYGYWEIV